MSDAKPTPAPIIMGEWGEILVGDPRLRDRLPMTGVALSMGRPSDDVQLQAEGNRNILFSALTIYHATGRTPRQLADERADLLEVLEALVLVTAHKMTSPTEAPYIKAARAAIAKTRGEA